MGKKTTAIVSINNYAIAKADTDRIANVIMANCGGKGLSADNLDRITVPAGGGLAWEVSTLKGPESQKHLVGVIAGFTNVRAYWAQDIDDGDTQPPDCSSPDGVIGFGIIDGGDGELTSRECSSCPMSQFGTAVKNGKSMKGQACNASRLLFLMRPESVLPVIVKLPATSLKPCAAYFNRLTNAAKPYYGVITRIGLQKQGEGGTTYSVATFEMAESLDEKAEQRLRRLGEAILPSLAAVTAPVGVITESPEGEKV